MSVQDNAKKSLENIDALEAVIGQAYNNCGGGDSIDRLTVMKEITKLRVAGGASEPSDAERATFYEAAAAAGVSKDGSVSLDELKADVKKILAKLAEAA